VSFGSRAGILTLHTDVAADRIGRRPVILAGILGVAVTTIFLGLSQSLSGIITARLLGMCKSCELHLHVLTLELWGMHSWTRRRQHRRHPQRPRRAHRLEQSRCCIPYIWFVLAIGSYHWVSLSDDRDYKLTCR
jgi:hypothetical protein